MEDVRDEDQREERESEPRIYELGFLLTPTIEEGKVAEEAGRLKEYVASAGGLILSEEHPKSIPLSYPMEGRVEGKKKIFREAYFGWVKFHHDPSAIVSLEKTLKDDPNVIRFLVIKVPKENTASSRLSGFGGRGKKKDDSRPKKDGVSEKTPPALSDAELDKTIEELVV